MHPKTIEETIAEINAVGRAHLVRGIVELCATEARRRRFMRSMRIRRLHETTSAR